MSELTLAFHVSDVRVVLSTRDEATHRALSLVWGNAAPALPPVRAIEGRIEHREHRAEVRLGDEVIACDPIDVVPTFEKLLYGLIAGWHPPPRVLLHAAGVSVGGRVIVLSGPSGSGKSSLALALVEQGARYLTDEFIVFDGERVWGIGRAPQFEPIAPGASVPARLDATDRTTYRFRAANGGERILPVRRLPASSVDASAYPAERVRVVFPTTDLAAAAGPVTPTDALRRLLEETRTDARVDFGPLLSRPARVMPWSSAPDAARRLLSWISRDEDATA